MARKGKEAVKKAQLNLKHVWTALPMESWQAELLGTRPESRWTRHGNNFKGRCPWHDDPGPSFVASPAKGIAKCFGCGKTFLNPVAFIAALHSHSGASVTFSEALVYLRKHHNLKTAIPDALYQKAQAWEIHRNRVNQLANLFCEQLGTGFINYPNLGTDLWMKSTIEYLMTRQLGFYSDAEPRSAADDDEDADTGNHCVADPPGVWANITSAQMMGVLPPMAVVENHFTELQDPEGFEFFRKYFASFMDQKYVGAIVYMYHDEPKSVARFKLRLPSTTEKVMLWVDDPYDDDMGGYRGFFGLNYYSTYLGGKREEGAHEVNYNIIAHITEGEFDACAATAQQIRRMSDDFMVLAAGGASVQPVDKLLQYGIERVRIIPDNDAGGQKFVQAVLERSNTEKVAIEIFQWPEEYKNWRDPSDHEKRIKDPDEAIKVLGYPKWNRYVRLSDSYQAIYEWAFERASQELSRVAADRVSERFRIAAVWGRLIHHAEECSKYCESIAQHFDIDKTNLFRDIRAREEDEEGFIKRLASVFQEQFYLLGVEKGESRKRILHAWHKERRVVETFVLNDERAIEAVFSQHYGNIYEFVRDNVGDPAFLSGENEGAALTIDYRTKTYRAYLNHALMRLAKNLPSIENAPRKAQGFHYIAGEHNEHGAYIVNGHEVHKVTYGESGVAVRLLDGPSDDGILFDCHAEAWHEGLTTKDFESEVDIVELFSTLRDMISLGWLWRAQDLDPTFLAALCMCYPVMSLFSRQTAIMLNAEASSGKSRFVSGFIGGTGFQSINLVAPAKALQVYTAASIRAQWNNTSLVLSLEEFEDTGGMDKKSTTVRNTLELTRDIISENAVNVSIGTSSGSSRSYNLRFPMVVAAIRPLRDAASLSRFIVFELLKEERRVDPIVALLNKWGVDGIAETRKKLSVGLVRYVPRLRELQKEVTTEFASGSALPPHVPARFREAMYPVLTMLKLITELPGGSALVDYKDFAWKFGDSRKEQLMRLRTTSENEQLFETLLSSMFQIDNSDKNISRVTSIRIMLADLNELDAINKTKKGVFIDLKNQWLVVNWIEATQGVLANTRYRGEPPSALKQVSERSPFYVRTEDAKAARVIERLVDVMGPGQKYDLTTVFSVKHLLEESRRSEEESRTKGAPTAAKAAPGQKAVDAPVAIDDDMVT
jgi:hypothetical protein